MTFIKKIILKIYELATGNIIMNGKKTGNYAKQGKFITSMSLYYTTLYNIQRIQKYNSKVCHMQLFLYTLPNHENVCSVLPYYTYIVIAASSRYMNNVVLLWVLARKSCIYMLMLRPRYELR